MFNTIRVVDLQDLPLRLDTVFQGGSYRLAPMHAVRLDHLDPDLLPFFNGCRACSCVPFEPLRRAVLRDALVAGQGAVVAGNRFLLRESVLEYLAHDLVPDGLATGLFGEDFRIRGEIERRVTGPAVLLQRPWFKNFGHWMVDGAALLASLLRVRLPRDCVVVVGRQPDRRLREIVLETIDLLAPGSTVLERSEHEVWEFEELHNLTPAQIPPLFKQPEAIGCLRAGFLRDNAPAAAAERRLFVRRMHPLRALRNEPEIGALLSARGFETLDPTGMSLCEQAEAMRSARVVVGVKGAALTTLLFAGAGADVVALSPGDFPDPFFWDLACKSGVRYSELFGPLASRTAPQSQNPFVIEPDALRSVLETLDLD